MEKLCVICIVKNYFLFVDLFVKIMEYYLKMIFYKLELSRNIDRIQEDLGYFTVIKYYFNLADLVQIYSVQESWYFIFFIVNEIKCYEYLSVSDMFYIIKYSIVEFIILIENVNKSFFLRLIDVQSCQSLLKIK